MKSISVSYQLSLEELRRGGCMVARCGFKKRKLARILGGTMVAVGTIMCLTHPGLPLFGSVSMMVVGSIIVILPTMYSWLYGVYGPSKNRYVGQTASWVISEDRLGCDIGTTSFAFGWDKVLKVVRGREGLLIFVGPSVAHWIPVHAFSSTDVQTTFVDIVSDKRIIFEDE